jgi:hypothetical protein
MTKPILLISSALLLSQCAHHGSHNASIAVGRYNELAGQEGKAAKKYRVTMKFIENGKVAAAPVLVARPGQDVEVKIQQSFVYPNDYKPAKTAKISMPASKASAPVTPITPTGYETRKLGYSASLNIRRNGGFVVVKGMLSHEKFAGFSRAPGEAISPLVDTRTKTLLSDNRVDLPNFVRSETPLYVAGLPGVEHVVDLPAIPAKVVITCEPIE